MRFVRRIESEVNEMDKEKDFDVILECLQFYVSEFGIRMTEKELETYKKYVQVDEDVEIY